MIVESCESRQEMRFASSIQFIYHRVPPTDGSLCVLCAT